VLQTEGQSVTAEQLARTVLVHHNGANVILGDVAKVVDGPQPRISAASIMGEPGVILMVDSQLGANALEVTRGLNQALAELRPAFTAQGVETNAEVFRAANFIETALVNVRSSLLIGAALVVVVLLLFLFNLRTAAISCAAIPLSLLTAVIVIEKMGLSINTMTLGGLAIAIGEVVDDAVIDVENIYRRLRENLALPSPRPVLQVVFDASLEVRSAVVYATFAVILVFFPVWLFRGLPDVSLLRWVSPTSGRSWRRCSWPSPLLRHYAFCFCAAGIFLLRNRLLFAGPRLLTGSCCWALKERPAS